MGLDVVATKLRRIATVERTEQESGEPSSCYSLILSLRLTWSRCSARSLLQSDLFLRLTWFRSSVRSLLQPTYLHALSVYRVNVLDKLTSCNDRTGICRISCQSTELTSLSTHRVNVLDKLTFRNTRTGICRIYVPLHLSWKLLSLLTWVYLRNPRCPVRSLLLPGTVSTTKLLVSGTRFELIIGKTLTVTALADGRRAEFLEQA